MMGCRFKAINIDSAALLLVPAAVKLWHKQSCKHRDALNCGTTLHFCSITSGNIQLWSDELWIHILLCESCFPAAAGCFFIFKCCLLVVVAVVVVLVFSVVIFSVSDSL